MDLPVTRVIIPGRPDHTSLFQTGRQTLLKFWALLTACWPPAPACLQVPGELAPPDHLLLPAPACLQVSGELAAEVTSACSNFDYSDLRVVQSEAGENEDEGFVAFRWVRVGWVGWGGGGGGILVGECRAGGTGGRESGAGSDVEEGGGGRLQSSRRLLVRGFII